MGTIDNLFALCASWRGKMLMTSMLAVQIKGAGEMYSASNHAERKISLVLTAQIYVFGDRSCRATTPTCSPVFTNRDLFAHTVWHVICIQQGASFVRSVRLCVVRGEPTEKNVKQSKTQLVFLQRWLGGMANDNDTTGAEFRHSLSGILRACFLSILSKYPELLH